MLQLTVSSAEMYDESTAEFIAPVTYDIELEHSLASVSKWESKYKRSFLSNGPTTTEEILWYIRCMVTTGEIRQEVLSLMTKEHFDKINEYVTDPMTATVVSETPGQRGRREVITSELVYYWMISLGIPFECQHWHFRRLLMLIRVCNLKNKPPKKMGPREALARQRALNAQRRAETRSRG